MTVKVPNKFRGYLLIRYSLAAIILLLLIGKNIDYDIAIPATSLFAVLGIFDQSFFGKPVKNPIIFGLFFGFFLVLAGRIGLVLNYLIWTSNKSSATALYIFVSSWWLYLCMAILGALCIWVNSFFINPSNAKQI